ncbi:MAG: acyl-CoA dehydrogenase family protein, partial [Gemmatimonadota bacterium]
MSEIDSVRELAHDFAEAELRPHVEAWDRDRGMDPAVTRQLGELGFFGMLAPEEHGGMAFDLPTYLAALEVLAWGEPAVALTLSIHSAFAVTLLLRHGTTEQKERWLPALASGDVVGCLALSEPDAGSDAAAVETRAERDGEGWRLTGEKRWVTNGGSGGLVVVVARTGGDGPDGLSAFLVPTDAAGYEVGARERTMGLRAAEVVGVRLNGVQVGPD